MSGMGNLRMVLRGALVVCMALPALGDHVVDFDDVATGSNFGPGNSFVSRNVQIDVFAVRLTPGSQCSPPTHSGAVTMATNPLTPCPNIDMPNRALIDQVLMEFDMGQFGAQAGGPIVKIKFKINPTGQGNVHLQFNGVCAVGANFNALAGYYPGAGVTVNVSGNNCTVIVLADPGTVINQFAIGADVWVIDKVKGFN